MDKELSDCGDRPDPPSVGLKTCRRLVNKNFQSKYSLKIKENPHTGVRFSSCDRTMWPEVKFVSVELRPN